MIDHPIAFRPHHFICALGFEGKGYSDGFTANMAAIVDRLRAPDGDDVLIEVTMTADHICTPCPHRVGHSCAKASKIAGLDKRHAAALGVQADTRLTWGDAKARMREAVQPGDLATLCAGCMWLDLGLCEAALARLHNSA